MASQFINQKKPNISTPLIGSTAKNLNFKNSNKNVPNFGGHKNEYL
jgi:hypothetical protein